MCKYDPSEHVSWRSLQSRLALTPAGTEASKSAAYWSRGAELHPISHTHIRCILDHPAWFGLSRDEVLEVYRRYGEKIGIEGKARREIIRQVIQAGWIRSRHYVRPVDYWSITLDEIRLREEELLSLFKTLISRRLIHAEDELRILSTDTDQLLVYPSREGGLTAFLKAAVWDGIFSKTKEGRSR